MASYFIFDVTPVHDPSYIRSDENFTDFGDFMREIALLLRDGATIHDAQAFDDGTLIVNIKCPGFLR